MKKKGMALGALLMAVVITAYSVCGTYAKYISAVDLTDEARVAKWGFNSDLDIDLFADSYSSDGVRYVKSLTKTCTTDEEGVKTCIDDDVVAPGTTGTYTFTFDGAADTEVAYQLDVTVDKENSKNVTYVDGDLSYSPILFRLGYQISEDNKGYLNANEAGYNVYAAGDGWITYEELIKTLESIGNDTDGSKKTYLPGDNSYNITYTIDWKWDFENKVTEATRFAGIDTDKYDTLLGQDALNNKVKLAVNITARQVGTDYSTVD